MLYTHHCPIKDCDRQLPSHLLMCDRHWQILPQPLKKRVYATWNRGRPANLQDYLSAKKEAIECVDLKLYLKSHGGRHDQA